MMYVCNSLNEFEQKQSLINNWRSQNISSYNAIRWGNSIDSKHQSEGKYLLVLPSNYEDIIGPLETIDCAPDGWFVGATYS